MTSIRSTFLLQSQISKTNIEKTITDLLFKGDRNAIDLIYQNYSAALYGIILRTVNSEEVAQEILQDVFVKIWKNSKKYNSQKGRLFTWLSRIARNASIDYLRTAQNSRNQKTTSINDHLHVSNIIEPRISIPDFAFKKIIYNLEEKHRILIELVYFQGYSQREVEEKMNIPLGTIKSRLRIAINELRKVLHEDMLKGLLK